MQASGQGDGARIHYMDNLRALAMLAGVVFHAALAYSPLIHPYWPPADAGGSPFVDVAAWFLHLFRMPLFFAVAGFFAALLAERRGMAGLFRNRTARVLLPLLVFLMPVLLGMHWLTVRAAATVAHPSPVLAFVHAYVGSHGALPLAPGLAHLWFLPYLLLFTVLVWVWRTLAPQRPAWWPALHPVVLPLLGPALLVPALAGTTVPWPAPESPLPPLWTIAYFGAYFALGYRHFRRPAPIDALQRMSPLLLVGAIAAYAALPWVAGDPVTGSPLQHVVHAALEAYAGAWMTLWCLLAGKRWLDGASRTMRWLSASSYWVYLVHLPVLFAIQYALLDVQLHWVAKFGLSAAATFVVSFASYQWLVRRTIVGRLLGEKAPTAASAVQSPRAARNRMAAK